MFASQLRTSLVLAGLLASGGFAQESAPLPTAEQRFAAWKLEAATGVPGPEALQELEALLESARAAEGSPELLASMAASAESLRKRLVPKLAALAQGKVSAAAEKEVMKLALEKAIAENNTDFIRSLGKRAVPALREMALAWDGAPSTGDQQPAFHWLGWLSAPDALDVALQHMASKSFVLKRSTITALKSRFGRRGVWRPHGETDWRLVNPEWEKILHLALEEPAVEPGALKDLLEDFVQKGQLPRSLGPVAIEARVELRLEDVVPKEGLWYLDLCVDAMDGRLRESAANYVTAYGEDDQVLKLARDPGARYDLAFRLLAVAESRFVDRAKGTTEATMVRVPRTPAILESFALLAVDKGSAVRNALRESLEQYRDQFGEAPFSSKELASLFDQVSDKNIRLALLESIKRLPEAERFDAAVAWIADNAKYRSTDNAVRMNPHPAAFGLSPRDDFFRLLDVWQAHGYLDSSKASRDLFGGYSFDQLDRLVENDGLDPEPIIARAQQWGFVEALAPQLSRGNTPLFPWVQSLSQESRVRLLRTVFADESALANEGLMTAYDFTIANQLIESSETLADMVMDKAAPAAARAWAVLALAEDHYPALDEAMLKEIAGLLAATSDEAHARRVRNALKNAEQQSVLRFLAAEPEATAELLLGMEIYPLGPATLDALWARVASEDWSDLPGAFGFVAGLAEHSEERLDTRLEQVDFSAERACLGLFYGARQTRNPVLLPLVRRVMERPDFQGRDAWIGATNALGAYMSEEAAGILLEAARFAPTAETRGYAMNKLREITEWQETAAAWEKSTSASAKRSQAVAELVLILDDEEQTEEAHAAALRGLGLLGAVEELPRIVRALGAKSEAIQEAARSAMQRLEE
jgi:hypothetical protein